MNTLLCAARGRRLTGPVRRLDGMPGYPGRYGRPGPDGRRHGPPGAPRGTCAAEPRPSGAPFAPHEGDRDAYGGTVPGGVRMCATRCVPDAVRPEAAE
ncbi:hypothetical protein [Streptomyces sp. Tu 3180]|uniref:hypothetical protein n=1 Tax=Streptomyces sp. Tu 3180 TaxID=2682611 RepID=UPI00135687E3|nr:hypothetical protein [Streptomyces sp. Tu 3180]KAF3467666.1 hypothetical protein GL259_27420 [Streptomyces sp. Tu 3180]